MAVVKTKQGVLAHRDEKHPLTVEQAQASADDRNQRAEELGIPTRYVVAED